MCNSSGADAHHVAGYKAVPETEKGVRDFVQCFPLSLLCDGFNFLNNAKLCKHGNVFCTFGGLNTGPLGDFI